MSERETYEVTKCDDCGEKVVIENGERSECACDRALAEEFDVPERTGVKFQGEEVVVWETARGWQWGAGEDECSDMFSSKERAIESAVLSAMMEVLEEGDKEVGENQNGN